jgi:hypothetical protein
MFNFFRKTSLYILAVPVLFTLLGAASNQVVLIANHDTFPVMVNDKKLAEMTETKEKFPVVELKPHKVFKPTPAQEKNDAVMLDDVHCAMTSKTHLNALADVFDMHDAIYSIGDFLLMLGEWLGSFTFAIFVFDVVRKLRKHEAV